jgi:hypothetical protein
MSWFAEKLALAATSGRDSRRRASAARTATATLAVK